MKTPSESKLNGFLVYFTMAYMMACLCQLVYFYCLGIKAYSKPTPPEIKIPFYCSFDGAHFFWVTNKIEVINTCCDGSLGYMKIIHVRLTPENP